MTRLYIVEQSSLEPGGHYFSYTCCVMEGARRLGLDPVILGNRRFRDRAAQDKFDIVPTFTHSWTEAEQDGPIAWEAGNIAFEIADAFRRLPPAIDDHVFLHTLGYRELRALLAWLTGKLPGDPMPYFHLLLRRDPDLLIEDYGDFADHFARLAASPYLQRKIRLHADTEPLAEVFAKVCGLPFAPAPIPFEQHLLSEALAGRAPRRAGDELTVAYLGDAREEKGFQHLPRALSYLWRDYIATGRVRFVLQSNFSTPGGERGMLSAAQDLAGFPATTLKSEPLEPKEYYELLAAADIVLIPYSPRRYRYRSSGVLVEAVGAGKVVVTSAGSWMATQVAAAHAVLFDDPAGLGPAIAEAIDRFDALSNGAQACREAVLARATGAHLVEHLLASARSASAEDDRPRRRVLFVMDGDAIVGSTGALPVAHAQLRYLAAAGHHVVGLFLTKEAPEDAAAAAEWRAALGRSIAGSPLERVFVAGPGSWGRDPDQLLTVRDAHPLKAEFDFVAGFEFSGPLLQFLRGSAVDAVLLNDVTNFPVIDALGLDAVPVICQMHGLRAFDRAVRDHRPVDDADLDEECRWLARCAVLLSLNGRETAIVRARLPDATVETAGVFLPPPPGLPSLAGARDLAEVVSSAGPEYRSATTPDIADRDAAQQLGALGSLDLLYVASVHPGNEAGLKWFLSEVYGPHLAARGVSMIVAGGIGEVAGWPQHPRLFFAGQVENLAPLYAAARVVVLPITEGTGTPVKTFEALVHGRPVVGTSLAFRDLEAEPGEFVGRDDPQELADSILDLLNSPQEQEKAAARSRGAAARRNDLGRYFQIMDGVFAAALGSAVATTPPLQIPPVRYAEWSQALQAVNRLVRCYLDGEPFEGWAVDLLAADDGAEIDRLLDDVGRFLIEERAAAVLQIEPRLKRLLGDPFGAKLRHRVTFAVRLAIAERRGTPIVSDPAGSALRAVVCGGLPVTVAGDAGAASASLLVDDQVVRARRLADNRRPVGGTQLFEANIAALGGDGLGLRTIELGVAGNSGTALSSLSVLRHSIPVEAGLRLLDRPVFGGGFRVRADGSGADLPAGETAALWLPRIVDGQHDGYIDLCFAGRDAGSGAAAPPRPMSALSILLDGRPAEIELIGGGALTVARIILGARAAGGEFGLASLAVANSGRSILSLVAVHSGLLLHPAAAEIATVLALAGQRRDPAEGRLLTAAASAALATILRNQPLGAAALDALCALSAGATWPDPLRDLVEREVARASRSNGASRSPPRAVDVVVDDVAAIVGTCLGIGDATNAIFCPALPFDIVDQGDRVLPAQTEAALRRREGSWRVAIPPDRSGERIRIRLDAALEIEGHPGVVGFSNFYPAESPDALFRWTGPEPNSTITIPVALNCPARLEITLGPTGRNTESADFTVSCNGAVVPHAFASDAGSVRLTAELPAARLAGPSTEIGLTVRQCQNPAPPDRRTLGVVFKALSFYFGAAPRPGEAPRPRPVERPAIEPAVVPAAARANGQAARGQTGRAAGRYALVIDDSVPEPDKDAGSNAVLQHILSLQRIGYRVGFIPADNMARIDPYTADLERRGVECFHRPDYASVEDVLTRRPAPYDLAYLHRCSNASRYGGAIRDHSPDARILYCVADLHFLRLQRQGELEGDPALIDAAAEMRASELDAMCNSDGVIVHSAAEAELLEQISPGIDVHVVPWTIGLRDPPKSPAKGPLLAFIGSYRHPPNVDAARWAAQTIMPLLRKQTPGAELLLVGSHLPPEIAALAARDVLAVGHVPSLDDIFGRVRLTIAPLRYGAGLKGKVLESLAAGIPCVMTTIAAEGLNLPSELQATLVADRPDDIVRRIVTLCRDERAYRHIAKVAREYVGANYSPARVDALLREVCGLPAVASSGKRRSNNPSAPRRQ